MNPERDDTLLDGCLDEVLAGRTPPDLSARILQAWAARGGVRAAQPLASLPLNGEPVAPPVQSRTLPTDYPLALQVHAPAPRGKRSPAYPAAAVAATLAVIAATIVGVGVWISTQQADNSVVQAPQKAGANPKATGQRPRATAALPKNRIKPKDGKSPDQNLAQRQSPAISDTSPAAPIDLSPVSPSPAAPPTAVAQRPYVVASPDSEVISFVNASVQQAWVENQVRPSALATDSEWCRRVYLRVLGRIPSVPEITQFTDDKAKDKRSLLVERLLTEDAYVEQYSQHWATVWANLLIGRTGGRQAGSLASREGLEQYLRTSLAENKPYDRIVHELLTATGSGKPGAADFNGAANFLLAGMNDHGSLATARTSRVFLGQQLQCAQCHEHPSGNWTQHQYWALNSFFRQTQVKKEGDAARLVDADFADEQGDVDEPLVYYQLPSGLLKSALPEFIDGTKIPPTGLVSQVNRRAELARLVVKSDEFPRALVNRYWSHFFGYGFTRPVDEMGTTNTPSHPELLERLAKEFVAHDFDLKSVVRWIVLSDPFQRSSQIATENLADAPQAGSAPLFTHYYTRQLPADEVYNSLLAAAEIRKKAAAGTDLAQARVDWLGQFQRSMATDDAEEETQFNGSMRQSLIMMNGDLMRRAVSSQHEGLLRRVVQSDLKLDEKIEHLFLAALSREPSKRELDAARKIVANNRGNDAAALEDMLWALLNSNEFILDH